METGSYKKYLTKAQLETFLEGATFGMEHSMSMADRRVLLPPGNTWCVEEDCIHSHSGIGADPLGVLNLYGGELQVRPCESEEELYKEITTIIDLVVPNRKDREYLYPADIHIHIRVPALLEDTNLVRGLVHWGQKWDELIADYVFPEWKPLSRSSYHDVKQYHHHNWINDVANHSKRKPYKPESVKRMDACDSEDLETMLTALHGHDPRRKGEWFGRYRSPGYQQRPLVNFGHLLVNETIEFRGFTATLDFGQLWNMIHFPLKYLSVALTNESDPLKIVRGLDFFTPTTLGTPDDPEIVRERRTRTNIMFTGRERTEQVIHAMLISGTITLAELNYPEYWINKGFQ